MKEIQKESIRDLEELEFSLHQLGSILWLVRDTDGIDEDICMTLSLAVDVINMVRKELDKHIAVKHCAAIA